MENVKALAKNKRWAGTIADIRKKAKDIGYETKLEVLNSADYGVPQTRERMFLVGFKDPSIEYDYPKPTVKKWLSVVDALRGLPPLGEPGNDQTCKAKVTTAKNPVLRPSPFAGMLFNGQGRPMDMDKPSPTLPASMGGNRTPIVDQETLETGASQWVEKYHAELQGGGSVVDSVPIRLRRVSVQEAAAIQTFPRGYCHGAARSAPAIAKSAMRFSSLEMAFAVALSVAKALDMDLESQSLPARRTWLGRGPSLPCSLSPSAAFRVVSPIGGVR